MIADLHIHTHLSDGAQTPEEVAAEASKKGLHVISVCDHNTIKAYKRLRPACEKAGLRLVQGVELDVAWRERTLHLLGYNFDPENASIHELMDKTRRELFQVSVEMVRKMLPDYPELSMEDYEAFTFPPGEGGWKGLHYLRARGLTRELMEGLAFHQKYGGFHPDYYPMEEACRIIREAGGVPVLAHPGCWWPQIPEDFKEILDDLRTRGVGGIECYYPEHSEEMTEFCVAYCQAHDLRITCGGDGHGGFNNAPGDTFFDIGVMRVDMDQLDLKGIV